MCVWHCGKWTFSHFALFFFAVLFSNPFSSLARLLLLFFLAQTGKERKCKTKWKRDEKKNKMKIWNVWSKIGRGIFVSGSTWNFEKLTCPRADWKTFVSRYVFQLLNQADILSATFILLEHSMAIDEHIPKKISLNCCPQQSVFYSSLFILKPGEVAQW